MTTQTHSSPAVTAAGKRLGALLVEDDPFLRDTLIAGLSDEFRVVGLEDAKDFLPAVYFYRPSIILLDLSLGSVSGLDLCAELRACPDLNEVRVLVITARRDNAAFLGSHDAGADDFLHKPFTIPELRTRMRGLLA